MIRGFETFNKTFASALKKAQQRPNLFGTLDLDTLINSMKSGKIIKNIPVNTMVINSSKRINRLHRAFLRNVLHLYRYSFVYLIYNTDYGVRGSTLELEYRRLLEGAKDEDIVEIIEVPPPTWLKNDLPTIMDDGSDLWARASMAWVETGKMVNAFKYVINREVKSNIVSGHIGFLVRAYRHGLSAAQRATFLEYGGKTTKPKPIIRLIINSQIFKKNYKKLVEKLAGKLSPSELRAITFGGKVEKLIGELEFKES